MPRSRPGDRGSPGSAGPTPQEPAFGPDSRALVIVWSSTATPSSRRASSRKTSTGTIETHASNLLHFADELSAQGRLADRPLAPTDPLAFVLKH